MDRPFLLNDFWLPRQRIVLIERKVIVARGRSRTCTLNPRGVPPELLTVPLDGDVRAAYFAVLPIGIVPFFARAISSRNVFVALLQGRLLKRHRLVGQPERFILQSEVARWAASVCPRNGCLHPL